MKSTKIERDFLLGLYLFMNQTQLSIHRSDWTEFSLYFKARFSVQLILGAIESNFSLLESGNSEKSLNLVFFVTSFFRAKNSLYDFEQKDIYRCVLTLKQLLCESEPDINTVYALRRDFSKNVSLLRSRISNFDKNYHKINHLNQSEHLETRSLKEILGKEWLPPQNEKKS